MLRNKCFNFVWRYIFQEKNATNMYRGRKVDFVGKFSALLLNDYVRGNQFSEVVHSTVFGVIFIVLSPCFQN